MKKQKKNISDITNSKTVYEEAERRACKVAADMLLQAIDADEGDDKYGYESD